MHDVYTQFHENPSIGSKVIVTHSHHDAGRIEKEIEVKIVSLFLLL
jgi:hypothetical protein